MWEEEIENYVEPLNLMIVDVMNLSFRYKPRATKFTPANLEDFTEDMRSAMQIALAKMGEDMLRTIYSLAKSYNVKDIILTADWKGSKYRKELYPEYKGNRAEKYANQTEVESYMATEYFKALDSAYELMQRALPLFRFEGVEADDLAAYFTLKLKDSYPQVWLISTDRDWVQLIDDTVSQFSYITRKEYRLSDMFENFNVDTPQQYAMLKCLQGDSGDNIKGVQDIGPKRGYAIIKDYDSILDLIEALPMPGKQKYIQRLNESADLLLRNYQLMDLVEFHETAIGDEIIKTHLEPFVNERKACMAELY